MTENGMNRADMKMEGSSEMRWNVERKCRGYMTSHPGPFLFIPVQDVCAGQENHGYRWRVDNAAVALRGCPRVHKRL
jgi:hypothetical protein